MTKQSIGAEPDINKLTGVVVGGVWGILLSSGNAGDACVGILPALTFRIKQYLMEFGWPKTQTDIAVFARAAADRAETILGVFHMNLNNATGVKREIEASVKKNVMDFQKPK